jgi:aminoglycoside phosphotransferase family enzyme
MENHEVIQLAAEGWFEGQKLRGKLLETNISWVILSEKLAFKIKKPIHLSFLDYATLDRRKYFCERELVLNSRFSSIYLSVEPIRYYSGNWSIGEGPGEILDYAVRMKKLRASRKMDVMLGKDEVREADIQRLAACLADFHQRTDLVFPDFDLEKEKSLFNDLATVRNIAGKELGGSFADKIDSAMERSNAFLEANKERMAQRMREGWYRDTHGDLHSGNIFLYRKPILFDCIEFNDSFRQTDLLYELAFLCMDLEFFGKQALSEVLLHAYRKICDPFEREGDHKIFRYYKALRANVRAKVYFLNSQSDKEKDAKATHLRKAKGYLELMSTYLQQ